MRWADYSVFRITRSEAPQPELPHVMRRRPLTILFLCVVAITLTGVGRFARGSTFPRPLMDALFIVSVVAGLSVSIFLVTKRLSHHTAEAIDEIEENRRK